MKQNTLEAWLVKFTSRNLHEESPCEASYMVFRLLNNTIKIAMLVTPIPKINPSSEELIELERIARSRKISQVIALRAKIIIEAH